jgi:hypothetical protein
MRKASTSAPLRLSPKPLSDNAFRVTAIAQPLEPLRKIRNLIIFRKNHAQMRNNSISSCCPPSLSFIFLSSIFLSPFLVLRFLRPASCPRSLSLRLSPPNFCAPGRQWSPSVNNSALPCNARKMQPHRDQGLPRIDHARSHPNFCAFTPCILSRPSAPIIRAPPPRQP